MTDEQKAALDLAILNLRTHGDDQLLSAVQPLIEFYESRVLAERKEPIATIRRDGSIFHTQWHREMPELFKLDVYAEPITEPEHSAIYISQKLTGSTKDAAFIQAHINQAVSEAMEAHPTPDDASDAARYQFLKAKAERLDYDAGWRSCWRIESVDIPSEKPRATLDEAIDAAIDRARQSGEEGK
jgi:hypothetical protein